MIKTLDLSDVTLLKGSHSPDSEYCVMELAAYLAGEPWSDHPACASPVITAFLVAWNDGLSDTDRQMLKPYAVKVIGTRTTPEDETTRAWMAADWLVRTCAPVFLRLTPSLVVHAIALEQCAPLTDMASAKVVQPKLAAAEAAAWAAAWAAAGAAAGAKLAPTVKALQTSALNLLDRMIAVGKHPVTLAITVRGLEDTR